MKTNSLCSYQLAVDSGTTRSAYAGCGFDRKPADMTGALRFGLSVAVKNAGAYRINLITDRYRKSSLDSGALLGWDVDLLAGDTGQFLTLQIADLSAPSWANGRTALLADLPAVATALLGVSGFTIQPILTWKDSVTLETAVSGWIQLDHVLAQGIETFIPSSFTQTTGVLRLPQRSRSPLQYLGNRTFCNASSKAVNLLAPLGKATQKIEAHQTIQIPQGIWIMVSESEAKNSCSVIFGSVVVQCE
jgi:hypothetical protein